MFDVLQAEAVDEGQPSGQIQRVQFMHEFLKPLRTHAGADLDADRIGDAAEILHVGAVDLRSAHSNPRHMGG